MKIFELILLLFLTSFLNGQIIFLEPHMPFEAVNETILNLVPGHETSSPMLKETPVKQLDSIIILPWPRPL